jgi:hypothetical protein
MKRVNLSWSQFLVLGASTIGSWMAGTTQSPLVPTGNGAAPAPGVVREMPVPVRLQEWRSPAIAVPRPERDVFTFKSPVREVRRTSEQPQPVTPAPLPDAPALRLIGMAHDGPDAAAATAIVAGHGQVYLVGPGDVIPPGYTVLRVDTDSIELSDGTTGATLRLFMK